MATVENSRSVAGIVLAAGKGTRMKSAVPKVLHPIAGKPMLGWVLDAMRGSGIGASCLVLSEDLVGFDEFLAKDPDLAVALQINRQGTGDAVAAASYCFAETTPAPYAAGKAHRQRRGKPIDATHVLISAGDTPALDAGSLAGFIDACVDAGAQLGVLGMRVPDPRGYGRMILDGSKLRAIVEDRDADPSTRRIDVCNTGIIFGEKNLIFELIRELKPNNSQKEYYLTDCVKHAWQRGLPTHAHVSDKWQEFAGINDRAQLAAVEAVLVRRKIEAMMLSGVTVHLPDTVYVEDGVEVGPDSEIGPSVCLRGKTKIGAGARIGAGSVLDGVTVKAGEVVPPLSVRLEGK